MKRGERPADWVIHIPDASSLRNVVEVVQAVPMHNITFQVQCDADGDCFLSVDGEDSASVCAVLARIRIDKPEGCEDRHTFCLSCKDILDAIDTPIASHGLVKLEARDAEVHVYVYDPDQPSNMIHWILKSIEEAPPEAPFAELEFLLTVEIEVQKLRETIKKAKRQHQEHIRIGVFLKSLTPTKELSVVRFSFGSETDTQYEELICHTVTHQDDGSKVVRAVSDGTDGIPVLDDPLVSDEFPLGKLEAFVKHVPCRIMTARMGREGESQGMPILFTHYLNGTADEKSLIRYLVAPKVEL